MSDIDFNPKVPTNDAAADAAAEQARDDEKKVAQKSAAFQNAMQRAGTTPGAAPPPTAGAAHQAQKQANLTATAGTTANVPQAAVLQQNAGQAKTAAGGPGVPGAGNMKTLAAQAPATAAGTGAGTIAASTGGGASDAGGDVAATIAGSIGGGSSYAESPIQQQRHAGSEGGREGQSRDSNNSSNNTLKPDIIREKTAAKDAPASHAEKPVSRIDLASIIPSFPVPMQSAQSPAAAPQTRPIFNADLVRQIVEYALVTQNSQGQAEFHMGLTGAALKGIGVHLTACGRRRVRIRFTGVGDSEAINDSAVSQLIESLRGRDVEVADVVME